MILDLVIEPRFRASRQVDSRFWNISGIRVPSVWRASAWRPSSLTSILSGGIAFDSPKASPVAEGLNFVLYKAGRSGQGRAYHHPGGRSAHQESMPILYEGIGLVGSTPFDSPSGPGRRR